MNIDVIFVDDDRRLVKQYAEELATTDFNTREFYGVDDVLAYLRAGGGADVIVWDMMMVPGREFEGREHNGGFSTGRLLYAEMKRLRPAARFVLLTNKDEAYADLRAQGLTVCMKTETTPVQLCTIVGGLVANIVRAGGT